MIDRRSLLAAGLATLAAPAGLRAQGGPSIEDVHFDPDNPVLGNPDGDVTVVEFFDYQCPFCKKGHADVVDAVASDGKVRLVMRDWPIFGDSSVHAARLVLAAAASGRYEEAQAALMATRGKLSMGDVDRTLTAADLDPAQLLSAYREDAARIDGLIARTGAIADTFGFSGTPSFVVGTTLFFGVMDRAGLIAAITRARAT